MVKVPVFSGSCTAIVTPFSETGVDYERLKKNIDFQYENGSSALVVCGTTGEAATLSENEQEELLRVSVRHNAGRMKIIAGIGCNDTVKALHRAENARFAGADAVLMVTPYYNKSTQKGLIEHFTYVADRVDIPMILYNVPSRAGIGIEAQTYKTLSEHPNINGVKEASGNIAAAAQVRSLCGDELYIWSGNDSDTVPLMSLGALGVISVAGNILPAVVAKLCTLCLDGDFKSATELYGKYAALFSALFIETNPIPIKTAMQLLDMDSGIMRLPLTNIGEDNKAILRSVMRDTGLNV